MNRIIHFAFNFVDITPCENRALPLIWTRAIGRLILILMLICLVRVVMISLLLPPSMPSALNLLSCNNACPT